jgi:hypothetical protein
MAIRETFAGTGESKLVYIRAARAGDLFAEFAAAAEKDEADETPFAVNPDAILYTVHAADGSRLAVLDDRESAFAAARAHQLEPVSVH